MTADRIDPDGALFKPLSLDEVVRITGRSRRTVERWVADNTLTRYEENHRRTAVFNEDEVARVEHEMNLRAQANRDRIAAMAGRHGSRKPPDPRGA